MGWRDEATLAALALAQEAGAAAMRELEARLDAIALVDAMTAAGSIARDIVRPAMRAELRGRVDAWFDHHARALRRVDPRLEALALGFSAVRDRPLLPRDDKAASGRWGTAAWLWRPVDPIGAAITRAGTRLADRLLGKTARDGAGQVSALIGRELGERSGAYDRLRVGGRLELVQLWIGPHPANDAPRPYLTQLLDKVDRTADDAREMIR